ncbi:hypothetical protein KDN32_18155 [Nocardioides sp. J2M5]|uniref:hypothetical protein n=1 Tax=Nocardioides palaemonis TaxID=2829810 RepID=UPI001BA6D573|nr:hypothetical protein [Nocardioides palaemonis]MBS2939667.1 hypothetical protein [Nocardioides palaemonis]
MPRLHARPRTVEEGLEELRRAVAAVLAPQVLLMATAQVPAGSGGSGPGPTATRTARRRPRATRPSATG